MNPRLRLTLILAGASVLIVFTLIQMYRSVVAPLQTWREERKADRAAYSRLNGLKTRSEVESSLSGWSSRTVSRVDYCPRLAAIGKVRQEECSRAASEIVYSRRETPQDQTSPLMPLRIVVVYDKQDAVIVAGTIE